VLTVGSIQAGADNNAIPATALVKANIRWYDPAVRRQLLGPHHEVPFTFLIVGVADPAVFAVARQQGKTMPYAAHNPNFVVDLKAIPAGTKIATVAMLELLKKG
jgi:metal-dependent amidase/aminoacylase/carboxypeptidase family protein